MPSRVACCYRLGVSHFCAKIRNVKVFAKIRCIGEHVSGELGINNHFVVTFPKSWTVLKNAQTTNYISHVYHSFAVWNKAMRKSENSFIPCSVEMDLTGIPTNGILTEIN